MPLYKNTLIFIFSSIVFFKFVYTSKSGELEDYTNTQNDRYNDYSGEEKVISGTMENSFISLISTRDSMKSSFSSFLNNNEYDPYSCLCKLNFDIELKYFKVTPVYSDNKELKVKAQVDAMIIIKETVQNPMGRKINYNIEEKKITLISQEIEMKKKKILKPGKFAFFVEKKGVYFTKMKPKQKWLKYEENLHFVDKNQTQAESPDIENYYKLPSSAMNKLKNKSNYQSIETGVPCDLKLPVIDLTNGIVFIKERSEASNVLCFTKTVYSYDVNATFTFNLNFLSKKDFTTTGKSNLEFFLQNKDYYEKFSSFGLKSQIE
jgi:hypothetical protein